MFRPFPAGNGGDRAVSINPSAEADVATSAHPFPIRTRMVSARQSTLGGRAALTCPLAGGDGAATTCSLVGGGGITAMYPSARGVRGRQGCHGAPVGGRRRSSSCAPGSKRRRSCCDAPSGAKRRGCCHAPSDGRRPGSDFAPVVGRRRVSRHTLVCERRRGYHRVPVHGRRLGSGQPPTDGKKMGIASRWRKGAGLPPCAYLRKEVELSSHARWREEKG